MRNSPGQHTGPQGANGSVPGRDGGMLPVVIFVLLAGALDTGLSHWEIATGLAVEANPLVSWVIEEHGWSTYWLVKCSMLFTGCGVLHTYRDHGLAQMGLVLASVVYVLVLAHHAVGLISLLTGP